MSVAGRLQRVREYMEKHGYDAFIIRDNASLRWLTGAQSVFDQEMAHTAFVTSEDTWLHTDSRYANSFLEKLPEDSPWIVDQDRTSHPEWVMERALATRSRTIAIEDTMQLAFHRGLIRAAENAALPLTLPVTQAVVTRMRAIKDVDEIELMRHAQSITDAAFTHMLGFVRPGMTEMSLKIELERFMLEAGATDLAFASIVASGPNSANPHAIPGSRIVSDGDFLLFDYGAAYGDYCSDMTRTIVVGEPEDWQREIYNVVLDAHRKSAALIRPGVPTREVHEEAARIISEAGYGEYFQHGLGHGVGIEIHELPNFNPKSTDVLEVGNVMTIEPGIYLPGKGGVRIEDYGVVTEDGFSVFTTSSHELQVL